MNIKQIYKPLTGPFTKRMLVALLVGNLITFAAPYFDSFLHLLLAFFAWWWLVITCYCIIELLTDKKAKDHE